MTRLTTLIVGIAILLAGCGAGLRKFPLREPMWNDPDGRPFSKQPEEYFSPFGWDGANQMVFRPVSRFFAVDPAGESVNVNALDEVPDSSWFTNRIGRQSMTAEAISQGACNTPLPNMQGPWTITKAKTSGFNPGFFVKGSDGERYVMKFDHHPEGPRPTAADVIATRLFHAAGYFVACNRIVYVHPETFVMAPDAKRESSSGKRKLTRDDVQEVFDRSIRLTDGRYRATVSLFVEGKPTGPWTYEGRRDDDPNDVINHEDRRELRGMYVLAAWLGYYDAREANTLASFIPVGNAGYVRHYVLDVGNSFGSVWDPPMLGRRIGHAYYLDFPYVLEDFVTLGVVRRPWDKLTFGRTGPVFGYYEVEHFDPDMFRTGYPNPAFVRRSERDSVWMARIIARFDNERLAAAVDPGMLAPPYRERLFEVLVGRRDKILRRYLTRLSPLAWPELSARTLCLEDFGLVAGVTRAEERQYAARTWLGDDAYAGANPSVKLRDGRFVCVDLPLVPGATPKKPGYLIVDVIAGGRGQVTLPPARVHLYHLGETNYRVVGLERPDGFESPG